MKISDKQYNQIASKLLKKGVKPSEAYALLESKGFRVKLKGKVLDKVYASRVIALMHAGADKGDPLEL